jgi:hypothetical protein
MKGTSSCQVACALALCAVFSLPAPAQFPALTTDIGAEHPLYLFAVSRKDDAAEDYARRVLAAWEAVDADLRPYAALSLSSAAVAGQRPFEADAALLTILQEQGVPVVLAAGSDSGPRMDIAQLDPLLNAHTVIRGISLALRFDRYDPPGTVGSRDTDFTWLADMALQGARYGRFTLLTCAALDWPRFMSNPAARALYDRLRTCTPYVIGMMHQRDAHTLPQQSALMGLWLEGSLGHWGVAPSADWYADAGFTAPGVYGGATPAAMPASFYRAMVLLGVMGGATCYLFEEDATPWSSARPEVWKQTLRPVLLEVLQRGLIPGKALVQKHTLAAAQLAPAATPLEFHANLRAMDGVLDEGLLLRAAYGLRPTGRVSELIPDSGAMYWVPLLSPWAPPEMLQSFPEVMPAATALDRDWSGLAERRRAPVGEGTAWILRSGRGIYVFHCKEDEPAPQTYALPLPAPVRGIEARREGNAVTLSWPFREGDVSYTVLRKTESQGDFLPLARGIAEYRYTDTEAPADTTLRYSVVALTSDLEPAAGNVAWGEFLVFSAVESRIAEVVELPPLLAAATSQPLAAPPAPPFAPYNPLPESATEAQRAMAAAIEARLDALATALASRDPAAAVGVYAPNYADPQGWGLQYVQRAFKAFVELVRAPRLVWQTHAWDFTQFEQERNIRQTVHLDCMGHAISDPAGVRADPAYRLDDPPRADITITWTDADGAWRILRTDPAFPNLRALLGSLASPYAPVPPGPDSF